MNQNTTYQYKALNAGSYKELAMFSVHLEANVQLFPAQQVINIDGDAMKEAGDFIDRENLDFQISPIEIPDEDFEDLVDNETADPTTLRSVICRLLDREKHTVERHDSIVSGITKESEHARNNSEMYRKLYLNYSKQNSRIKMQILSIGNLLNSIFPDENLLVCKTGYDAQE